MYQVGPPVTLRVSRLHPFNRGKWRILQGYKLYRRLAPSTLAIYPLISRRLMLRNSDHDNDPRRSPSLTSEQYRSCAYLEHI